MMRSASASAPMVKAFYEPDTGSVQYVVWRAATKGAAIIDPVWNYDPKAARTSTKSADEILAFVREEGLTVEWVLDTHPHADHFSAVGYLTDALGAKTGTGEKVRDVAAIWRGLVDDHTLPVDGAGWSRLFADGDRFEIGGLPVEVIHSPGHTLASISFVVGDPAAGPRAAFVHDTFFMPDTGTARADFPGGSSSALWDSLQRILSLEDTARLLVGHDYRAGGSRSPEWERTVAEMRTENPHVAPGETRESYQRRRDARDATLAFPDRMIAALQVNLRGGRKPPPAADGISYLKLPLDRF